MSIHHPGYTHGRNHCIFVLPAYDSTDSLITPLPSNSSLRVIGIHYGTVFAACRIVACNEVGSLRDQRDNQTVSLGFDDILPAGKYFYELGTLPSGKILN